MSQTLTWGIIGTGIIGTGRIAGVFANGLAKSQTGTLIAVASRTQATADRFGESWNVSRRYDSYERLLADKDVQAVYIAVPHPAHAEWAIKATEAGKHILCEKPIVLNHADAMTIIEAAQRNDVFLMEAFMYRCHPQIAKLVELIQTNAIGKVRVIEASFAFNTRFNPDGRLFKNALGGGGILDVGCYPVSIARLIAGAATGNAFADPIKVTAVGQIGKSHVDEYTIASLVFPAGILAQLFTGVQVNAENVVRVFGSEGSILLPAPWLPVDGQAAKLIVERDDEQEAREVIVPSVQSLYGAEADTVARSIDARQATTPAMSWEDTLGNMSTLDQWRAAIGLTYETERADGPGQTLPVHKRPLAVCSTSIMKYGHVAGVAKPISRLVMGVDNQRTWPHTAAMLDDFFETARGAAIVATGVASHCRDA